MIRACKGCWNVCYLYVKDALPLFMESISSELSPTIFNDPPRLSRGYLTSFLFGIRFLNVTSVVATPLVDLEKHFFCLF